MANKIIQSINPRTHEASRNLRNKNVEQIDLDEEGNIILTLSSQMTEAQEGLIKAVIEMQFQPLGYKTVIFRYGSPNVQ